MNRNYYENLLLNIKIFILLDYFLIFILILNKFYILIIQ